MILQADRATLEGLLVTNFSSVTVNVPPELTTSIDLPCEIQYLTQDIIDKILEEEENNVVIGVEYPTMDLPWTRNLSDRHKRRKEQELISTQAPAVGDWVRVNGAVTATFTFTTTEPNLSRIGIYTKTPVGSTSWMWFELTDEFGNLLFRRLIFTTHLRESDWIYVDIDLPLKIDVVLGTSRPLTVTLTEETYGANPIGIDIGKDVALIANRIYASRYAEIVGKVSRGIMRISVFAKDKKVNRDPTPAVFMGKDDIVAQAAEQLRQYIWANWTFYGLNDLMATILSQGETSNTTPFATSIIDVFLVVPDFGTVAATEATIKDITIEHRGV